MILRSSAKDSSLKMFILVHGAPRKQELPQQAISLPKITQLHLVLLPNADSDFQSFKISNIKDNF